MKMFTEKRVAGLYIQVRWLVFLGFISVIFSQEDNSDVRDSYCETSGTESYSCNNVYNEFSIDIAANIKETIQTISITESSLLTEITDRALEDFPVLTTLSLINNDLGTLQEAVFSFVPNLNFIDLTGNDNFLCNATINWLKNWQAVKSGRRVVGTCSDGQTIQQYLDGLTVENNLLQFSQGSYQLSGNEGTMMYTCSGDVNSGMRLRPEGQGLTFSPAEIVLNSGTRDGSITVTKTESSMMDSYNVTLVPSSSAFPSAVATVSFGATAAPEPEPTKPMKGGGDQTSPTMDSSASPSSGSPVVWIVIAIVVIIIVGCVIGYFIYSKKTKVRGDNKVKYSKAGQSEGGGGNKVYGNTTVENA